MEDLPTVMTVSHQVTVTIRVSWLHTPHVSSRWDALKPTHDEGAAGTNKGYNHHQQLQKGGTRWSGASNIGKKVRNTNPTSSPARVSNSSNSRPPRNFDHSNSKEASNTPPQGQDHHVSEPASLGSRMSPSLNGIPPPPPGFQHSNAFTQQHVAPVHHDYSLKNETASGFAGGESKEFQDQDLISSLLAVSHSNSGHDNWKVEETSGLFPTPGRNVNSLVPLGGNLTTTIQENPFSNDDDFDSQIEAELQELGQEVAGSILDF